MKVKNIMFSGFAAAILMGVVAEASAAPVAVASKGYVDSIAGKLTGLTGAAEEKENLVDAINVKQDKFTDGTAVSTTTGFVSSVTQTNGTVAAGTTSFDTVIDDETKLHENTAPTTKAVADAIQDVTYTGGTDINIDEDNEINATYDSLDYMSTTDEADFANKLTDGYAVSYVAQENGKVKIGAKEYVQRVNATSAEGQGGRHAPSTAAVWEAIQGVSGQTDDLDLAQVGADGSYIKLVSQADGLVSATAETFDTVVDSTTAESTKAPTTAAVYDAIEGVTYQDGTDIDIDADNKVNATYASLDYDSYNDTANSANKLPDGYSIVRVQQTDGDLSISAKAYVTEIDAAHATEKQAPTTEAVYNAIQNVSQQIPDMPGVCTETGVTCVLTSEGGAFKWAVLTNPVTDTTISGTEAQAQAIEEPATGDDTVIENPGL